MNATPPKLDVLSIGKDILTILVIPAFIWVNSVSTDLNVIKVRQENRVESVEKQLASLKESIDKIEDSLTIQANKRAKTTERLVRLEERLNAISNRYDNIRNLLANIVRRLDDPK